jgi:hypothetical protein
LQGLKAKGWKDFQNDFNFTRHDAKKKIPEAVIDISSDDDNDIPVASGSTFVMPSPKKASAKGESAALVSVVLQVPISSLQIRKRRKAERVELSA